MFALIAWRLLSMNRLTYRQDQFQCLHFAKTFAYTLEFSFQHWLSSLFSLGQQQNQLSSTVSEATFDITPYKLHLLDEGPKTSTVLTREDALKYYKARDYCSAARRIAMVYEH